MTFSELKYNTKFSLGGNTTTIWVKITDSDAIRYGWVASDGEFYFEPDTIIIPVI